MKMNWTTKGVSCSMALLFFSLLLMGQQKPSFFETSDTLNIKRRNTVYITEGVGAGIALLGLNQLWYADYERSNFHFYNDNSAWLQMDKFGHTFSSYYMGKMGMDALSWAGESQKNQLLFGATLGFTFLTAVEVLDGFSEEWGFSVGDMAANALGTGILIGQELLWNEQRIQMKFSFQSTNYPNLDPNLGTNTLEQILKDYNGQTYWLSANLWSFFKESKIPKWLNVSFGYGAEDLPKEIKTDAGEVIFQHPYRQFYTSLDIDLTKINTKSAFLKTTFNVLNFIKIPSPTLEITSNGDFIFHPIFF